MLFGANGAVLSELDEAALEREEADKTFEYGLMACIGSLAFAGLLGVMKVFYSDALTAPLVLVLLVVTGFMTIIPAIIAFAGRAAQEDRLPRKFGAAPKHRHVAPGVAIGVVLALLIVLWVARFLEANYTQIRINDRAGLVVIALIIAAFSLLIFLPHLFRSTRLRTVVRWLQGKGTQATHVGRILFWLPRMFANGLSVLDSWAVHAIAPMSGVTQTKVFSRYAMMVAHLAPAAVLAWYLPPPVGLAAIIWAALIAVSVARRWAWTEDDREYALRNPDYDEKRMRVGVQEDLRDEALLALLFMIFLLPLGMRQMHGWLGGDVFSVPLGANTLQNWMSFFGVELAKSIPFVDWVDIYAATNDTIIESKTALSSHVVFVARAIVDLVFLAALLQAISVAMRWAKHKAMFFAQEIDRLDPLLERDEFAQLAVKNGDEWLFSDRLPRFAHYHSTSLSRLRLTHAKETPTWQAATQIIRLQGRPTSSPSEQFAELALLLRPDLVAVTAAYEVAKVTDELDYHTLVEARRALNWKQAFNPLRIMLVQSMVALPDRGERLKALRHTLQGDIQDSIAPVRRIALEALIPFIATEETVSLTIQRAAEQDPAKAIREAARVAVVPVLDPHPEPAW